MEDMPLTLVFFLAIASFVRLWLAMLFPITADESYYWLWSKHLSLSYVDHPPMVAIINFFTTFGKENLLGLRIGVVIISLLVSILLYYLAKRAFNEKIAFWSVILFQLLPHFLVIWLTMFVELPLVLFWAASLLVLLHIIQTKNKNWWYLLAVTIGLGCLSKYTMFLFWPCLALFFLLSKENRFWLKKKELYFCFGLSLFFFLPVLIWNNQHQWVSFLFHSSRANGSAWGHDILPFIADQLVHFTPFLLFAIYGVSKYALKRDNGSKLLFSFSIPILLLFLILSIKIKIWAHWPEVGYIGLIPLAIAYMMENGKSWQKFFIWMAIFTTLIISILFWVSPAVMLHQKDYNLNYKISDSLPPDLKIFTRTNVSASLLEFYTQQATYLSTGFLKIGYPWGERQYDIWGIPNLAKGENIIYFGEDSPEFEQKAAMYFDKIAGLPEPRLYLIEDYINNNYHFFLLKGFKGGDLHP
jgi:4-amino-4-deoxy-L-arabinose transferase-like glycosyltransferase